MACTWLAVPLAFAVVTHAVDQQSELAVAGQTRQHALEEMWSRELADTMSNPVARVLTLLDKMKTELTHEGESEAEMYEKMVCWCETNDQEKTKAIHDAGVQDKELSAEVEARSARFGELGTEIGQMKKQITQDSEALKEATAIREREAGGFRSEEVDLVQAITNLKNAIAVLTKHQGDASFLQLDDPLLMSVRVLLRDAALKHEMMLPVGKPRPGQTLLFQERVASEEHGANRVLLDALDSHGPSVSNELPVKFAERLVAQAAQSTHSAASATFLQSSANQPDMFKSYSSRSNVIYGILTQMLEEFEAQLKRSQGMETTAVEDFKNLATVKREQIDLGKRKLDVLETEHAANQKALADAEEDLELTRKQRAEDVEFLRNLKLQCQDLSAQWDRRSATRKEELAAVSEALLILTSDEHKETIAKTHSFLQAKSTTEVGTHGRRSRAAEILNRAAQQPTFDDDDLLAAWHNRRSTPVVGGAGPRAQLSALAVTVQLDSFTKVKKIIETMIEDLKTQELNEVKFKAKCVSDFDKNEKMTFNKNEDREKLENKISQLERLIQKLQDEISLAKKQSADTSAEIMKASQNRGEANTEFQTVVGDQRATRNILNKALLRLTAFYKKEKGGANLIQKNEQTPPMQFNKYETNAGANPVIGLLDQIIGDSVKLDSEACAGEYQAQMDYETFVKDSNSLIAQLSAAITTKTKSIAAAKGEGADTKGDHLSVVNELDSLALYEADLHQECDFVMKNFEVRQKARLQEAEALQQAKAFLAGAKTA